MFDGRSQFFNLPLLGLGTSATESLRSYIYRLAMAHRIRPKGVMQELLRRHGVERAASNVDDTLKLMNIHANGGRANRLIELLGVSTGVDLEATTLGRFQPTLSPKHLIRRKPFYCPDCVRTDVDAVDKLPHGHLIWEVECVSACPLHGVRLRPADECGAPAKDLLPLNSRPKHSAVCNNCASIGFRCITVAPEKATDSEVWVARQVSRLVAMPKEETMSFTRERLQKGLVDLISARHGGSDVQAALNAGLSRNLVWYWTRTDMPPSLPLLLQLCASCNADPIALLRGCFEEAEDRAPEQIQLVNRSYRRLAVTPEQLRIALLAACSESPPPSATAVARRFNMTERRLRTLAPDELAQLVSLNTEHRRAMEEQSYAAALKAYEAAAIALRAEGKYVGDKYLQQRAGLAAFSHNHSRRRAIAEVLARHGGR